MKDSWRDLEEIWNSDDYRHLTTGRFYGESSLLTGFWKKRWLWQSGVAVLLFFSLLVVFQMEGPAAVVLQDNIRYVLAAGESDLTPVLEAMARSGLWLEPFDNEMGQKAGAVNDELLAIPVSGKVARRFGEQRSPIDHSLIFHNGIDILAEPGAAVRATLAGTVVRVELDPYLGRIVELEHHQGLSSLYGNLGEVLVDIGQTVEQGEILGKAGGNAPSHMKTIHFEVRDKGVPIDPMSRMAAVKTSI
ncbi:MAG: M23 family metallopeptidase [Clostridia bacterium]|nr:M23 family metallopeptidase [Clostridia bacterium]